MQPVKSVLQHLCSHNLAAQLEGCIVSFFSDVADIELLTDHVHVSPPATRRCITTISNFGGSNHGFIAINCAEALARKLALSMMGESGELPESCLCSALGEAVNILNANLLEIVADKKYCKVSIPAVIRNDSALLQKLLDDTRGYTGSFLHGTEQILIKVVVLSENCLTINTKPSSCASISVHQAHQLLTYPRFGKPCRQVPSETAFDSDIPSTHSGVIRYQQSLY